MRRLLLALALLAGCDQVFGHELSAGIDAPDAPDAPVDAPPPALAPWSPATPLPEGRDYNHPHAALVADTLYMIGGFGMAGETSVVYRARVTDRQLGAWTVTTPLPSPRALGDVVTIGARIYVVGGANGGVAQRSVYFGDASSGGIGAWSATTQLPVALKAHAAAAAGGWLYLVGGGDALNVRQTAVYRAAVLTDGQLGAWQPAAELPAPRANLASVAARGSLYAIGGDDTSEAPQSTVYYAALASDGTVGPWSTTTALPTARKGLVAVTDADHIYVLGGSNGDASAEVLYSRIGSDGTLGPWEVTAPMLQARQRHAGVLANGQIFVLGGAGTPTSVEHTSRY